jgi:hypothetical protein
MMNNSQINPTQLVTAAKSCETLAEYLPNKQSGEELWYCMDVINTHTHNGLNKLDIYLRDDV